MVSVHTHVYRRDGFRQSFALTAGLCLMLGTLGLGGCAGFHLGNTADPNYEITGSVTSAGTLSYAGSDRSDWNLIRETVAASISAQPSARIAWENRATGNSGTISNLVTTDTSGARSCRRFSSTITSVDGVRLYHSEVCKSPMNTWEFAKISPADAA